MGQGPKIFVYTFESKTWQCIFPNEFFFLTNIYILKFANCVTIVGARENVGSWKTTQIKARFIGTTENSFVS